MPTTKWKPLENWMPLQAPRELDVMRQRFEEEIARPFLKTLWDNIPEEVKGWTPSIDVFENGDSLIVKVELPGMKHEDIDVAVAEDTLTVKGERKPESGVKSEDKYRSEIAYGTFYRRIPLPFSADTKSVQAMYEDGILNISLQRTAGTKPKKVNVQVKTPTA